MKRKLVLGLVLAALGITGVYGGWLSLTAWLSGIVVVLGIGSLGCGLWSAWGTPREEIVRSFDQYKAKGGVEQVYTLLAGRHADILVELLGVILLTFSACASSAPAFGIGAIDCVVLLVVFAMRKKGEPAPPPPPPEA